MKKRAGLPNTVSVKKLNKEQKKEASQLEQEEKDSWRDSKDLRQEPAPKAEVKFAVHIGIRQTAGAAFGIRTLHKERFLRNKPYKTREIFEGTESIVPAQTDPPNNR